MKLSINFKNFFFVLATAAVAGSSCTKLHENLNSTLTTSDANKFSDLFLQAAYNDIGVIYEDPSNIDQLQEVTTDESFIPIRGTDWFDGGYHVSLHLHNWQRTTIPITETEFTALNKLNYDATAVLGTDGTPNQLAQARVLRALSLYELLDLFGQFPIRQPGDNLLLPAKVFSGDSATQFIISELTTAIPDLSAANTVTRINPHAAKVLLMKAYLNRGAFANRATPTFADADMQQIITLGNAIMANSKYSFAANYFDIFSPNNAATPEAIFSLPNSRAANTGSGFFGNIQNRWYSTLHYNMYTPLNPQAGWNGFATMGEFYNTFAVNGATATQTAADASLDGRLGNKPYAGVTDKSGVRPGILIGQQYNENGVALNDRKPLPLIFTNASEVPANIDVSLIPSLETAGFRVIKYSPDYTTAAASYQVPGNYYILFRYAEVLLMVAEAKMRAAAPDNAGALTLVNKLRVARQAVPLTSMTLVNTANVYAPNTLLAERGRELYWEGKRRPDLIRFGVWKNAWRLKPADAGNFYIFPLPAADLSKNPNLIANLQGSQY